MIDTTDPFPIHAVARTTTAPAMHAFVKGNPDLVAIKFIMDTEGVNKNLDHMPRGTLVRGYATIIHKPFDIEHVVKENGTMLSGAGASPASAANTIHGVVTHAALANSDGDLLDDKAIQALDLTDIVHRPEKDRLAVVAWAVLYNIKFPKTTAKLVEAINAEKMWVSMDRFIYDLDYLIVKNGVVQAMARTDDLAMRYGKRERINSYPIIRRTLSFSYGGVGATRTPANQVARFLPPMKV